MIVDQLHSAHNGTISLRNREDQSARTDEGAAPVSSPCVRPTVHVRLAPGRDRLTASASDEFPQSRHWSGERDFPTSARRHQVTSRMVTVHRAPEVQSVYPRAEDY